tara:strand:- start:70 stop:519 length:450 start_codon:yes stop_codon:yes gene_type:complete
MAISRGAGTEIIRSAHFEDIDSTAQYLIFGVQHHIYTVLSIIVYPIALQATTNKFYATITGYDARAGTTNQDILLFRCNPQVGETFVWNDKYSFNGHEPTDYGSGDLTIVKQDAIADQGSAVPQYLKAYTDHADDSFEVTVTFIDQNNA